MGQIPWSLVLATSRPGICASFLSFITVTDFIREEIPVMQLGRFELHRVSGGRFRIDGGTMFGVVPRVLWERNFPTDEQHRIAQETNCVLIQTGTKNILIDTGYGPKLPDKQRQNMAAEHGEPLLVSLGQLGLTADDIDTVIFSHLHFDHAGGATRLNEAGELVPVFPRAEYIAQRHEWIVATADYPELRGAYPPENLLPLKASGQLRLMDGNVEILPGIRSMVTGGHTEAHQALVITSDGQTAAYLGDICATWRHLPVLWCMGYDVHMRQTRRAKADLLGLAADEGWMVFFNHDPDVFGARLKRDSKKDFATVDAWTIG